MFLLIKFSLGQFHTCTQCMKLFSLPAPCYTASLPTNLSLTFMSIRRVWLPSEINLACLCGLELSVGAWLAQK